MRSLRGRERASSCGTVTGSSTGIPSVFVCSVMDADLAGDGRGTGRQGPAHGGNAAFRVVITTRLVLRLLHFRVC
jgi:hypothetical protein